jgi:hypothetical protein
MNELYKSSFPVQMFSEAETGFHDSISESSGMKAIIITE